MPRSIWNGTLSVGVVHVPVKLYSATESKTVHFHEVHLEDGARIEHRRFCAKEDKEVPYEEVVKGHEVASGEYVVLDKDEIKAAAGGTGHLIEVEHFVSRPTSTRSSLRSRTTSGRARRPRTRTGCCAMRWSARAERRSGASRSTTASTSRSSGRWRACSRCTRCASPTSSSPATSFELEAPRRGAGEREVKMAGQLVESLHQEFRPERYQDEYREAVLGVIKRKAAGKDIEPPAEEAEDDAVDLTAALQASLDGGGR